MMLVLAGAGCSHAIGGPGDDEERPDSGDALACQVAADCEDNSDCTDDICDDRTNTCNNTPNDSACDDGENGTVDRCSESTKMCANTVVMDCDDLLQTSPETPSGVHYIDPDGAGGNAAYQAYCDMTTRGGGWTLVAKILGPGASQGGASSAHVWEYNSVHWTTVGSLGEPTPSLSQADAKYRAFNELPGTEIMLAASADEPVMASVLSISFSSLIDLFENSPEGTAVTPSPADDLDFGYIGRTTYSICESAQSLLMSGMGGRSLEINKYGAYSLAAGRARIGYWESGSNAGVPSTIADCVYGVGVWTTGYGGARVGGTTATTNFTTIWVK